MSKIIHFLLALVIVLSACSLGGALTQPPTAAVTLPSSPTKTQTEAPTQTPPTPTLPAAPTLPL